MNIFLKQGLDLDDYDSYDNDYVPLFIDEYNSENTNSIRYFIENGVNFSVKDKLDGMSGISHLMYNYGEYNNDNLIDNFRYLIQYGVNFFEDYIINSKDDYLKNKILIDYSTYFNSKDTSLGLIHFENKSQLSIAYQEGYSKLEHQADINTLDNFGNTVYDKNKDGYSALMMACESNNLEMIKYYVNNSANVNKNFDKFNNSYDGLFIYYHGDDEKYLMEHHADINEYNKYGIAILIKACYFKSQYDDFKKRTLLSRVVNKVILKLLKPLRVSIRVSSDLNLFRHSSPSFGLRSLIKNPNRLMVHRKSHQNHFHYVYELLGPCFKTGCLKPFSQYPKRSTSVSSPEGSWDRSLMCVCEKAYGTNVNVIRKFRLTVLSYACKKTEFIKGCKSNNSSIIKYLIYYKNDININKKYLSGHTELMKACENGNIVIVHCLIEHGKGMTALMVACKYNQLEIVNCLIEHGSDINIFNIKRKTSLILSIMKSYFEITKYLIEHETIAYLKKNNFIVKNNLKYQANGLISACKENHLEMIQYMIDHDANVNVSDNTYKTPLMNVCHNLNYKLIQFLIDYGADLDSVDIHGNSYSILMNVCENNNLKLVKYFTIRTEMQNLNCNKSLKIAFKNRNYKIIVFLIEHEVDMNSLNYCDL
ncbi:ankyrin repeat-containing domain protein [Neocallimastix sp. 'constans']